MKRSIKVISVIAALAAGTSAFAQQSDTTPATGSAGLLGKRYAEASFGFLDVNHSRVDAFGAGLNVNVPLNSNLDLNLGYAYAWVESFSDVDTDIVSADLTTYFTSGNLRPLGTLSLGHVWAPGDDVTVWGGAAGVEYDFSRVLSGAITGGYTDDFKSGNNGEWNATARANLWITRSLAANVTVSYLERGNVGYSLGMNFRF